MVALELPILGTNHTLVSLENSGKPHSSGSVLGICDRAAGLLIVSFCRCCSRRGKMRRTPRSDTPDHSGDEVLKMTGETPASRLQKVLTKLCPIRRRLATQRLRKASRKAHPIEAPGAELGGNDCPSGYGGVHIYDPEMEWARDLWPYEPAHPKLERQLHGSFPAYTPGVDNSDQDVGLVGHYRPGDASPPIPAAFNINANIIPSIPSPTRPHRSDRQDRRFDLHSPLTIVPPRTPLPLAGSQSDGNSAYIPYSPYEYYTPHAVSAVPSSSSSYDDVLPSFIYGTRSLHSSNSDRSTKPPRSPVSLRSDGVAPSMSRSSSSGRTEFRSLPPPTPTHLQSQRAPIDSDNIVCLGPLPDNIHLPSLPPSHLQSHPQASRQTPPRAVYPHEQDSSVIWPTTRPISPIQQDPLLHDSSPLPPYHSPVTPILNREQSTLHADRQRDEGDHQHQHHLHQHQQRGWDPRRRSTDSLGSNFTVEEEARIQAQIVRNLSMLGQERVGGEGDMVHIPQPSERRFSFEYDP